MNRHHPAAIWAVTAIAVAGTLGVVGLEFAAPENSEPLLIILVGFLAPTIAALLGNQKATEVSGKLDKIDGRLNGELDGRIEAAVERALAKWTQPPSS